MPPPGPEPVAALAQSQPEAVATIPNLQVDGGYALPNAAAHIDTAVDSHGNLYVAYEYLDGSDYDLSSCAGTNTAQVRFRFTTDDFNYGGSYGVGWYEDNAPGQGGHAPPFCVSF